MLDEMYILHDLPWNEHHQLRFCTGFSVSSLSEIILKPWSCQKFLFPAFHCVILLDRLLNAIKSMLGTLSSYHIDN